MPENGIDLLPRQELMTYEEMLRVSTVLVKAGIEKIRITGGEPFVRKDIMPFLYDLSKISGLREITITTNGVLTAPVIPDLKKIGVRLVNLSLDTIDRNRFFAITRRDALPQVMETMDRLLEHGILVKLNAVVMDGKNTEDIIPLVDLTKELPISVRFIEEMPFNGSGSNYPSLLWDHLRILNTIKEHFPEIRKIQDPPYSTSYNYNVPGHKGNVGIIAAYTRSFCGSCNRIRITPQGMLKTCLYDGGVLNVKDIMRKGNDNEYLVTAVKNAINNRAKDGWVAEQNSVHESMSSIGG
jgi:molybdenum cofactor biosynthesis enzyme MoaA